MTLPTYALMPSGLTLAIVAGATISMLAWVVTYLASTQPAYSVGSPHAETARGTFPVSMLPRTASEELAYWSYMTT